MCAHQLFLSVAPRRSGTWRELSESVRIVVRHRPSPVGGWCAILGVMSDDFPEMIKRTLLAIQAAMATKEDLAGLVSREDLAGLVSKEDLAGLVSREDLAGLASRLDGTRAEIMARIDRLQDALTTAREADVVTWGAMAKMERMLETSRKDIDGLSEQIAALVRQIRLISGRLEQLENR